MKIHPTLIIGALLLANGLAAQFPPRRPPRGLFGGSAALDDGPTAKDEAEKRILAVAAGVPQRMNVPMEDGRVIRALTEAIGARHAVEIGTSTGYSGLWFALALRKTGGRLTTFELEPDVAESARTTFRNAGVDGLINVVAGDAHETVRKLSGPIDIVFIDADKEGYRDYLEKLLPLIRPGGLILAHNISGPGSNPEYVEAITKNPDLESFQITRQMALTLKKR